MGDQCDLGTLPLCRFTSGMRDAVIFAYPSATTFDHNAVIVLNHSLPMIWLHKSLPLFVLPLGLCLALVMLGLLLKRRWVVFTGLTVLWGFSLPVTGNALLRSAEQHAVRLPARAMPTADAIVVLSGMVRPVAAAPGAEASEWGDAIDRIEGGITLWKAGKALRLVLTGGQVPWLDAPPESEVLAQWAQARGVDGGAMLQTPPVANTAQEAAANAQMLPAGAKTLLVTSASHMPRAQAQFARAGFDVTPYPVDFQTDAGRRASLLDWLPQASALEDSSLALREWIGRAWMKAGGS